jgi:hypothetical protein
MGEFRRFLQKKTTASSQHRMKEHEAGIKTADLCFKWATSLGTQDLVGYDIGFGQVIKAWSGMQACFKYDRTPL